jgi:hypothetical protein
MKLMVAESGLDAKPCLTYDSRPEEATKEPVGRLLSERRSRMYASSSFMTEMH